MKVMVLMFTILVTCRLVFADKIKIVTEHFPPYQFAEGGEVAKGLGVEIVEALLKEASVDEPVTVMPWARAYEIALHEKNVLIFSLTRTTERESMFHWVGPIIGAGDSLWKLIDREDLRLEKLDDAKQFVTAVPRNDGQQFYLEKNGFKQNENLQIVTKWEQAIEMLFKKRVDLIMGSKVALKYRLEKMGLDNKLLTQAFEIGQMWGDLYIALSKNTDEEVVEKLKTAYQRIVDNGTYKRLVDKWLL